MDSKTKKALLRKWRIWLKIIGQDLGELLTAHNIYERVVEIHNNNEHLKKLPTLFFNWIFENYAARLTMGIRRISDKQEDVISLYNLIHQMQKNRDAITRNLYISKYSCRAREEGFADRDYNQFANRNADFLSVYKLTVDLNQIARETNRLRKFANKWIAHTDPKRRKKMRRIPTYEESKKALDSIDRIYCKYYMLLTRGGLRTRKPVLQYDWKEPLRIPWIEEIRDT